MENSSFNNLSAELRNEIYSYLLPADDPIQVYPFGSLKPTEIVQQPITLVCSQIRHETRSMLYGRSNISFPVAKKTKDSKDGVGECLHQSVAKAVTWIKRNSTGNPPLIGRFALTVNLENRLALGDSRMMWRRLAKTLKQSGYTKNTCVILVTLYSRPSQQRWLQTYQRAVEKIFREHGLGNPLHF
jgi:hypothetical protein